MTKTHGIHGQAAKIDRSKSYDDTPRPGLFHVTFKMVEVCRAQSVNGHTKTKVTSNKRCAFKENADIVPDSL